MSTLQTNSKFDLALFTFNLACMMFFTLEMYDVMKTI